MGSPGAWQSMKAERGVFTSRCHAHWWHRLEGNGRGSFTYSGNMTEPTSSSNDLGGALAVEVTRVPPALVES